jgi:hypothetical protein
MSLRNVVLMLGLGAAASLHAATEFENGLVPAELVREFAGGTVYKSLPDNFPAIPLPATVDLRLIGSMEQFSSQRLLLRTSLGVDAIRAQLRTALLGAGWVDLSIDPSPLSLCHDQHGSMQISTTDRGGDNRVHVSRSFWPLSIPRPGTQTCAEQLAARQGSGNWYT